MLNQKIEQPHNYGDAKDALDNGDRRLTEYPALFSYNREYRYTLSRQLAPLHGRGTCAWILLNPSTADETKLDPTLRRCADFTARWGYQYMLIGNIFAYRATDPADMKARATPVGYLNDDFLLAITNEADMVICGWGTNVHKDFPDRGQQVRDLIAPFDPHYLKLTQGGHPSHPLYLPKHLTPQAWRDDG